MELGLFSVSLTVKNIQTSYEFYKKLGFDALEGCGSVEDKWLILKNDGCHIGIFEGMFDKNILTFNPTDVRSLEKTLKDKGVDLITETEGEEGPTHIVFEDPDGNRIMIDQH